MFDSFKWFHFFSRNCLSREDSFQTDETNYVSCINFVKNHTLCATVHRNLLQAYCFFCHVHVDFLAMLECSREQTTSSNFPCMFINDNFCHHKRSEAIWITIDQCLPHLRLWITMPDFWYPIFLRIEWIWVMVDRHIENDFVQRCFFCKLFVRLYLVRRDDLLEGKPFLLHIGKWQCPFME